MTCPVSHSREEVSQGFVPGPDRVAVPRAHQGSGHKVQTPDSGSRDLWEGTFCLGGQASSGQQWVGLSSIIGVDASPALPRQPPYHPPSGSPHKVTLGGERLAPPCRRGLFCEPLLSLGLGPVRRARERLGGGADTRPPSLPCCEARPGGALTSLVLSPLQNQG